jgi:hypothetical protein
MGLVTIIVLGVVAITTVGILGDMVTKIAQARAKARQAEGGAAAGEIERLRARVASLEARVEERDESLRRIQDELRFVSRMLEDRSSPRAGN